VIECDDTLTCSQMYYDCIGSNQHTLTHTLTHMHSYLHIHILITHFHIYSHTYTRSLTHTYTHTHTHTHTQSGHTSPQGVGRNLVVRMVNTNTQTNIKGFINFPILPVPKHLQVNSWQVILSTHKCTFPSMSQVYTTTPVAPHTSALVYFSV